MITVAIPTLARPAYALDVLRSVAAQVCGTPFEVLILDNGCDSHLAESVRLVARSARVPVVYVPVSALGLHNARHEAARRAQGDIVAYLDDDVVVDPGWLAGLAASFVDPSVHLVGGRCLPMYEADPPPWLEAFWTRNADGTSWCGHLTLVDLGRDAKDIDPMQVWGANFAIRKETLIKAGGFHPDGVPWHLRRFRGDGETAVSIAVRKLGLRAAYSPDATVHHRVSRDRLTEEYFERRAFLQGISNSFSAFRSPEGDVEARPRSGLARRLLGRLEALTTQRVQRKQAPPPEWQILASRVADAQAAGYAYHQEQLQKSLTVQEWVRKPDYWSGALPEADERPLEVGSDGDAMHAEATD